MFPRIDKGPIEYTLDIYPAFNVEEQKECMRFLFRTTEEFHHFRYNIAVEEKHAEKSLQFTLRGLKAKGLLPGVGVAESIVDVFDLSGSYDITVTKPGDIVNTARISVGEKLRLLKNVSEDDCFLTVAIHNVEVEKE
ncbi:MAG: hypothetical protein C0600_16290 [Ignavibacteria bacterium]|nr:MAG: hypothetical protein C0600_16290 [Ignavibacteria bacterium]